ncbi:MAG TPA: hypothetical protein VMW30_01730 [Candidatus Paceibacterota bacterium]|nr:hypothetical protein [Candidatus Paceibacterota bacterium]
MASGIIYLSIVGMWVAYFVPRWVHSHEESSGKSVERYKSALRTVTSGSADESIARAIVHSDLDYEARVAQVLMRRRIVFGLLIAGLLITLSQAIFNSLSLTYSLIPVVGFAFYVAHVRRQSVADRLQRRRVNQLHRTTAGVSTTNLSKVFTPNENRDHWVPLAEREISGVVILPKGTSQVRNSWSPQDVPVPTYVYAPKAVASSRIIDLTIPGAWSDEQERLAQEALSAVAPTRDEVFDQQMAEEAVERLRINRAANE